MICVRLVRRPLRGGGAAVGVWGLALLSGLTGCRPESSVLVQATVAPTDFATRAARRAYDGAPPVIPHPPLGAECTVCHTALGQAMPGIGFAPANPHLAMASGSAESAGGSLVAPTVTRGPDSGTFANCRQCHVFQFDQGSFRESNFQGLLQQRSIADRLYPGAPPVMPHSTSMRENCVACHATESARPEIRCSHPERFNCRQCHMEVVESQSLFSDSLSPRGESAR